MNKIRSFAKANINRQILINNKPVTYLVLFVIGSHLTSFFIGVHHIFTNYFCVGFFFFLLGLVFSVVCLVATIRMLLNGQNVLIFTIVWIFIAAMNFIPGIFPSAAGSVMTLVIAGPDKVVQEGRELLQIYQSAEDEDPEEINSSCVQLTKIPPSIERVYPAWVRVCQDRVIIKKFGIGDVAGFLIYPEGVEHEGFKLFDGIYWIDAW